MCVIIKNQSHNPSAHCVVHVLVSFTVEMLNSRDYRVMEPTKNIQSFSFTQASCVNWRSSVFPDRISGDLDNKYPAFKDRHKFDYSER